MKNHVALYCVFGAATLLTAMGLAFCWSAPSACGVYPDDPRLLFRQTLIGTLVGAALCVAAAIVGWRRWLKAAPFIFTAWGCLLLHSLFFEVFDELRGVIILGPLEVNLLELCPLVVGLMAAYVSSKLKIGSSSVLLFLAGVGIGMVASVFIADAVQMHRSAALAVQVEELPLLNVTERGMGDVAHRCSEMIRGSGWFGSGNAELDVLWCAFTVAMPALATAMFGKWYLVSLSVLIAVLASGFAIAWRGLADEPKRAFVVVLGLAVVGQMMMNFLGCLQIVPLTEVAIPWASSGGSMAAVNWLTLGVVAAAFGDGGATRINREAAKSEVFNGK